MIYDDNRDPMEIVEEIRRSTEETLQDIERGEYGWADYKYNRREELGECDKVLGITYKKGNKS